MTGRIIFLLEEESMAILLEGLLPRLFPGMTKGVHFLCVKHDGKSDLEKSVPRKLRAWKEPGVRFVILRDNDGGNCIDIKARLTRLCRENGREDTLVRIVCQELESWYIGDLQALAAAFDQPAINTPGLAKRFADPDTIMKPSVEVRQLLPQFQKRAGARAMGAVLNASDNRSRSFASFIAGLAVLTQQMGYGANL